MPDGAYDERAAIVAGSLLVAAHVTHSGNVERVERERRARGVTFREYPVLHAVAGRRSRRQAIHAARS